MDFGIQQQVKWWTCDRVIAQSGDICRVGSWVVVRKDEASVFGGLIDSTLTIYIYTGPNGCWQDQRNIDTRRNNANIGQRVSHD